MNETKLIITADSAQATAELQTLGQALDGTSQKLVALAKTNNDYTMSAGQLRMATRMLPAQFTDIWVSLASGQNPMMVLIQQGGQIKDMFGGLGPAIGAMKNYVVGLINPLTITATVLGAGAYAWYKWGEAAKEAGIKASDAAKSAEKDASAAWGGVRKSTDDQISALQSKIVGAQGLLDGAIKRRNDITRETDAQIALSIGREVGARRQEIAGYQRQIEQLRESASKLNTKTGRSSGSSKQEKTDPIAGQVISMENETFRKQMELLGVAPAQIKVYELAMKGATLAQIESAQAAANQIIAVEAQIKSDKDAAKSAEEASKARLKAVDEASKLLGDINPQIRANQEWEKLIELQRTAIDENGKQILSAEDLGKAYEKIMKGINNDGTDAFKALESAVRGWGDQFTNTFADMAHTGELSFSSLADSVLRDIERIVIQTQITKPLLDNLFGANYGAAGNNTMGGIVGDIWGGIKGIFNANGNVYSGPGIGAYSSTVVDRPTLFPFARGIGLMGEAGPEAILPLKRINGKLGVQSDGSGSGVTVNIINQAGAKVSTQERRDQNGGMSLDVIIEQVEGGLARNISRGSGELSGTLERTFGLNRSAGAYR